MMKMRMRPMEAMRTGTENQDGETAREENGTATTTTMVPSSPNTALRNCLWGHKTPINLLVYNSVCTGIPDAQLPLPFSIWPCLLRFFSVLSVTLSVLPNMGDTSRTKNNAHRASCRSNANTPSLSNQDFFPRANLEAQLHATSGPVSSVKEASTWLKMKGWALTSKTCTKIKLAKILFSVVLVFKLPADTNMAIHSVAHLL
jgi:hypothetical protein